MAFFKMYYNMTHYTYDAGKLLLGRDGMMQVYKITLLEMFPEEREERCDE